MYHMYYIPSWTEKLPSNVFSSFSKTLILHTNNWKRLFSFTVFFKLGHSVERMVKNCDGGPANNW